MFINTHSHIPLASFMIFIASRDVFDGIAFAAFSANNISVVVAVMMSLSLIESSMIFFQ